MELSFLTIVVSLAVCSLLIYAVFQYMKVRLNVLEQSQKEQALILQQFIEESSTDIHRLYKLSATNGGHYQPQGSIILEYANELVNENNDDSNQKQQAYNEPHIIHLDTAFYQNKKNNLIEISSDSEDTTESENDDSSSTCSNSISESEDDASESSSGSSTCSDSDSDSDSDDDEYGSDSEKVHPDPIIETIIEPSSTNNSEVVEILCDDETTSDIKLITVDLGTTQESPSVKSSPERPVDVLSMLYKKTQEQSITVETTIESEASPSEPTPSPDSAPPPPELAPSPATATTSISYTSMSVPELRQLLKEKYKQHPEKHAEIQKLKKAELVYALQTASV